MSTAIAEPPAVTTVQATPEQIKADATAMAILRPSVVKDGKIHVPEAKETPKETSKSPEKPAATPVSEKPPTDKEINLAELRKAREASDAALKERETELEKTREEFEAFKKNPIPKEYEERLTAAEKRAQDYQRELQTAALARDPEFQRKYAAPIDAAIKTMSDLAVTTGAEKSDVLKAVGQWNEAQFAEWAEAMPLGEKMRFQAAYQRAIELDSQRSQELADSDRSWNEMQKQRQADQEHGQSEYLKSLQRDRANVLAKLGENEIFKSDEEVRKQTEQMLDRVIGANGEKMPADQVLTIMGSTFMAAHQLKKTLAEKDEMATKLTDTEKKLADAEAFIKSVNSGIPIPNPTNNDVVTNSPSEGFLKSLIAPKVRA